ncbi:HlyD family efflux transporter periplasmic adaptor subunit [filamentous cyanobacterium LEGE 11480]|uniref:HlyD family efflux transporter periplasmic adaptor subunit n=1 Tax=Romeriopsis navalis LEGE 11480 TaxID=2777977 RepID=A0A928Z0J1_9CYAN|nr:HlyD family secretion protein [Romeriopsis navalis]MBE9028321.1 HlyD family efflux transporter periplasmic adaptor subunit [Romeriopsis navalis LEGE 11480]
MLKSPLPDSKPQTPENSTVPQIHQGTGVAKRLLVSLACLGLGATALRIGSTVIQHRLTHFTVETGIINSRTVQLRAPIDGTIAAFYAQPGVPVQLGQVIAKITPPPIQKDGTMPRFQAKILSLRTQLSQAEQGIAQLQLQLGRLGNQDQAIQLTQKQVAATDLQAQQAAINSAIAKADAAKTEYRRLSALAQEGAIAGQLVDQTKMAWDVAEAEVNEAKAKLSSAQVTLTALQQNVPVTPNATLMDQRLSLQRLIQKQTELAQGLKAEIVSQQQQLQSRQTNQQTQQLEIPVKAPFSGVVYRTDREIGEQVNRPDLMLTIADCNNIWVEALLPIEQVQKIDATQPVQVLLAGQSTPQAGKIELIQATTIEALKQQSQAVVPLMPLSKQQQALVSRVTVKLPPLPEAAKLGQFCGIGQSSRLTFKTKSTRFF